MVVHEFMPKTLSAAEFKATCLEVLDTVARTRQPVIVTKRGQPVARVVPLVEKPKPIVGALRGTVEVPGDIISPIRVGRQGRGVQKLGSRMAARFKAL